VNAKRHSTESPFALHSAIYPDRERLGWYKVAYPRSKEIKKGSHAHGEVVFDARRDATMC
jgi:hypothetical protein